MDNTQDKQTEAKPEEQQQNEAQQQPEAQQQQQEENADEAKAPEQPAADDEVEKLKKQIADLNDKYVRTCAEYDNYRKRTAREKADLIKGAGSDILAALLPVIDDFERALAHMNDDADVNAVKDGVALIYKKFNDYLAKRGVTVIETKELPLDTNVHEAITMIPAPTPELKGKILDCVEKGYMLGDKVLRFAKVVVGQ
ncbi:MAG: nucleotide exchange factor GrpE [Bacteroidales bacterium]|nr:nucleotide exchange factor GrpE [Bacteroidales bacterium]MDD7725251.1 nucleotide exchange factor GrpE [Bacteroidales bacterium]